MFFEVFSFFGLIFSFKDDDDKQIMDTSTNNQFLSFDIIEDCLLKEAINKTTDEILKFMQRFQGQKMYSLNRSAKLVDQDASPWGEEIQGIVSLQENLYDGEKLRRNTGNFFWYRLYYGCTCLRENKENIALCISSMKIYELDVLKYIDNSPLESQKALEECSLRYTSELVEWLLNGITETFFFTEIIISKAANSTQIERIFFVI